MTNDELLAMLRSTPAGVLSADLRRTLKLGKKSSHKRLARLKAMGLLTTIGLSIYARWCVPEHVASASEADRLYRQQLAAESAEKRREYEKSRVHDPKRVAQRAALNKLRDRKNEKRSPRKPRPVVEEDTSIDSWPVLRSWVAAENAPRMTKPRIASVWDLAR